MMTAHGDVISLFYGTMGTTTYYPHNFYALDVSFLSVFFTVFFLCLRGVELNG